MTQVKDTYRWHGVDYPVLPHAPPPPHVESMKVWIERYGQPSPGLRPILERHFEGSGP